MRSWPAVRHTMAADWRVEDAGHVGDRLAPADMRGLRVDDQRQPAKLGDADVEGDAGAQRRLVEQDRDRLGPSSGR